MAKVAIIVFPGSNCDRDVQKTLSTVYKLETELIWYSKSKLARYDAIIIPGGFSYADRLRAGAIAAHTPIIGEIKRLAHDGVPILGICNGFQILVESKLLPGALTVNKSLRFICRWIAIKVLNNKTPFTNAFKNQNEFNVPIAHGEGRYVVDNDTLKILKRKNQIVLIYPHGNPNGSVGSIAGVCNERGNVVGVMPHPERGCESILTPDGLSNSYTFFYSLKLFLN
jgi:phosphoribosylformylglycinamidine synthase I